MQAAVASAARGFTFVRLLVMVAIFAAGGLLWLACAPGAPTHTRVSAALGAVLWFALPVRIVYVGARQYYRTGSWTVSKEEVTAVRARTATDPKQQWIQPASTALLVLTALFSMVATAVRMHRHGPSAIDMFFFVGWLVILASQLRQLYGYMRKLSRRVN